jgi:hypothetical protein
MADLTADDLITAMRFNDSLLQECILEGSVVQKILPPPPRRPHSLEVVVEGGEDISKLPGADKILELTRDYGPASNIPLADIPVDYVPLVQLIRDGKIVFKTVEDSQTNPVTHRDYDYVLAQFRGDITVQLYGGTRHKDALAYAFTTKGNLKSTLEYFAGTWERVDQISPYPVNAVHEQALWYYFSLGVGFGERVQSATLRSNQGRQYVLDAKVSIWPGKVHDAQLVVDSEGLVRKAHIQCNTKHIRSTSTGARSIADSDTHIASQGQIEVKTPGGRELVSMVVKLGDAKPSLTESDFAALSDLSLSEGTPVYYYKDGYNSQRELLGDADNSQNRTSFRLVLLLVLLVVALIAYAIRRRQRQYN